MSGKVLGIIGAVTLAVFTVALDKYWDTAFIQGIVQGISNLPATLVEPVGVPLWMVIVAALLAVVVVLRINWILVQRNLKLKRMPSTTETEYKTVSVEFPPLVSIDQKKILSFLGYVENNESIASLMNLSKTVKLSKLNCDYALEQLQKSDLVLIYKGSEHQLEIMLTPKGKKFIVTDSISTEWHAWLDNV